MSNSNSLNPGSECPSKEKLAFFCQGEGDFAENDFFAKHMEECQFCQIQVDKCWEFLDKTRALKKMESQILAGPSTSSKGRDLSSGAIAKLVLLAKTRGGEIGHIPVSPVDGALGRLGPYDLLALIGQGGMGMVFECVDSRNQQKLALKTIRPERLPNKEFKTRFLREVELVRFIQHASIVPVLDSGEENGIPYFVMPLLQGQSTDELIRKEAPLALDRVLRLGAQAADALEAAHKSGIIHRDIKPSNLWVEKSTDGRETVRLLDFGLARLESVEIHNTSSQGTQGTPAYFSPERAEGKRLSGPETDVFSLGCVIYEMATGHRVFQGKTVVDVFREIARFQIVPPIKRRPEIGRVFSSVIMHCLEKKTSDRYQTPGELANDLRHISQGVSTFYQPPGFGRKSVAWIRNNAKVVGVTAFVGTIMLFATIFSLAQARRANNEAEKSRILAERNDSLYYISEIRAAEERFRSGRFSEARTGLDGLLTRTNATFDPGFEWHHLDRICSQAFEILYPVGKSQNERGNPLNLARSGPDSLSVVFMNGFMVLNRKTQKTNFFPVLNNPIPSVLPCISPNGAFGAFLNDRNTLSVIQMSDSDIVSYPHKVGNLVGPREEIIGIGIGGINRPIVYALTFKQDSRQTLLKSWEAGQNDHLVETRVDLDKLSGVRLNVSPDGSAVVVVEQRGRIFFWNRGKKNPINDLIGLENMSFEWSHVENVVFVLGRRAFQPVVAQWDGKEPVKFSGFPEAIHPALFLPTLGGNPILVDTEGGLYSLKSGEWKPESKPLAPDFLSRGFIEMGTKPGQSWDVIGATRQGVIFRSQLEVPPTAIQIKPQLDKRGRPVGLAWIDDSHLLVDEAFTTPGRSGLAILELGEFEKTAKHAFFPRSEKGSPIRLPSRYFELESSMRWCVDSKNSRLLVVVNGDCKWLDCFGQWVDLGNIGGRPKDVVVTPHGIVAVFGDGTISGFDLNLEKIWTATLDGIFPENGKSQYRTLSLSPDGEQVGVIWGTREIVCITCIDTKNGGKYTAFQDPILSSSIGMSMISPTVAAIARSDGSFYKIDLATKIPMMVRPIVGQGNLSFAYSPGAGRFGLVSTLEHVRMIETKTWQDVIVHKGQNPSLTNASIACGFSPNGWLFAYMKEDGTICILDGRPQDSHEKLAAHSQ